MADLSPTIDAENLDFESTLIELEKVVTELDGEIKLERALSLFDRGMLLSAKCQKFLETAEQKIAVLRKNNEGALSLQPLSEEGDDQ